MPYNIQNVYIADGFADDCDELMHRCLQEETVTFEVFSNVWKSMQLSCLFQDRNSGAEIAELSEEVIHIAKHYMVADTSNFEESVCGLFLVYALLNLQPFTNFAALRIVQDDIPAIERIELVARRDRRQDVLYILGSVLIQGPVHYQAVLRERGMEYPIRKYLEGYTTIDKLGVRPKGVFYRQNVELDIIRELNNLAIKYSNAKAEITVPGVIDRNLNYVNDNFPKELQSSLKNIISGIIQDDNDESSDHSYDSIDAVKAIKDKAMKSKVNPIRHRIGVATRSSSPTKCEIKSNPGKVRNNSPSKVATSSKNNLNEPSRKRKRKSIYYSNSDEYEDEIKKDSTDSESDQAMNSQDSQSTGDDLDLASFLQTLNPAERTDELAETEEQEIDIAIDALPCVIRSENDGKSYEIEIIDKFNAGNQNVNEVQDGIPGPSTSRTPDSPQPSTSGTSSKEKKEEESDYLKRAEKRDLKKTILKSRFKRMGMLPVANFQTK